jgi:hypothetical protein
MTFARRQAIALKSSGEIEADSIASVLMINGEFAFAGITVMLTT